MRADDGMMIRMVGWVEELGQAELHLSVRRILARLPSFVADDGTLRVTEQGEMIQAKFGPMLPAPVWLVTPEIASLN